MGVERDYDMADKTISDVKVVVNKLRNIDNAAVDKVLAWLERFETTNAKVLTFGRHRLVYQLRNCVLKFAHNIEGVQANCDEVKLSRKRKYLHYPVARCKSILTVGDCVIALIMECVDEKSFKKKLRDMYYNIPPELDWIKDIDCRQVGYTRSGKVVAYDYSII